MASAEILMNLRVPLPHLQIWIVITAVQLFFEIGFRACLSHLVKMASALLVGPTTEYISERLALYDKCVFLYLL